MNVMTNNNAFNIPQASYRFNAMICTGGIGSGTLFQLNGNHTLGREESRSGNYLDARDYCKMHIIAHYVSVLTRPYLSIYPVGKVGDDQVGHSIYREMEAADLKMDYVEYSPGDRTLFGFCFLYPDGTGGNLTTDISACSKVNPEFIETALPVFQSYKERLVSLAAPEVPLDARKQLLMLSHRFAGFNVASFTSSEMADAQEKKMLSLVDLLAINMDEAAALAGMNPAEKPDCIINKVVEKLMLLNPKIFLSITHGKNGSWSWDGNALSKMPAFPAEVKSSAGAGDAHLAGIISGLSAGLTLKQAHTLGSLAAAYSVTSEHTIHPEMNRKNLRQFGLQFQDILDPLVINVLE